MAESATRKATYDDLLAVPEHLIAEIIDGALETRRFPPPKHAYAYTALVRTIAHPFLGKEPELNDWWVLNRVELHLGEHVLVPDLAGWRRERLPKLPETAWFELPPDWVCEIISPATARLDRGPKREIYDQFAVPHLWFVDPDARTLEAFALRDGAWVLIASHADDDEIAVAPFATVPFALDTLWAD